MSDFEQLVERLEQIALDEYFDDPEGLEGCMAERQSILTALQNADASGLSAEQRDSLKGRLCDVLARDGEHLLRLRELATEAQKAQEQLVSGRKAVRGYGDTLSSAPPSTRRIG